MEGGAPSWASPAWSSSTSSTGSGPASSAPSTSCSDRSAPASPRSSCRSARRRRSAASPTCSPTRPSPTTRRHADDRRRSPTTWRPRSTQVHDTLVEGIVVADDDLLERYLEGDVPERRGAGGDPGPRRGVGARCSRCCAARPPPDVGVDRLADFICEIGPSPARPARRSTVQAGDQRRPRSRPDPAGQPLAVGVQDHRRPLRRPDLAVQGAVGHRSAPTTTSSTPAPDADERLHGLFTLRGKEQDAGRRGAGRRHRRRWPSWPTPRTGDTLAPKGTPVVVPPAHAPPAGPGDRHPARSPRATTTSW